MIALLLLVGLAAAPPADCVVDWTLEPRRFGLSYLEDIQPVWNQYCADCHVQHAGNPRAGLDLEQPFSYYNLVDVPTSAGTGLALVSPFRPADSLLQRKLDCDTPGPTVAAPAAMPLGRPRLPRAVRSMIHDWIAAGAQVSDPTFVASGFEER